MLARVASSELTEWQAFERVHGPLGQTRDDIHTALLLAMLHNQWAKHPKKPAVFLPEWDQPRLSVAEKLKSWAAQFGGDDGDT
jgi:hypothetical protein